MADEERSVDGRPEADEGALQNAIKQADMALMGRCFLKLQRHVERSKQRKHYGRCATLLKHSAVKKLAVAHFLRWLFYTRRRAYVRMGFGGLPRIVAFPSNRDFIYLGIRYFRQWRLWLREVRQRRRTNTALLQNKTMERCLHRNFLQWQCFAQHRRHEALAERVDELTQHNKRLRNEIVKLEHLCEENRERESALKSLITNMETHRNCQFRELERYRQGVKEVLALLRTAHGEEGNHHKMRRAAADGLGGVDADAEQDPLFLLLSETEGVRNSLEKLRKALPVDCDTSKSLEEVTDSLCMHINKLDGTFDELMGELHSSSSLTTYMRNVLRSTGENIMAITQKVAPPNIFPRREQISFQAVAPGQSNEQSQNDVAEWSFVDWEALELVKDQLMQSDTLTNGIPSTVSVLENLDECLMALYKREVKLKEHLSDQQRIIDCTKEQVRVLADAAEQAIGLIQSWCSGTAQHQRDTKTDEITELTGVKVCGLAALLRYESEVAADALSKIRHILFSTRPHPRVSPYNAQDQRSVVGGVPTEASRFVSYNGLVNMVRGLQEQYTESLEASHKVYDELRLLVSEYSPASSGRESCASVSSESCNGSRLSLVEQSQLSTSNHSGRYFENPLKLVEPVLHTVRSCFISRDRENMELRGLIQRAAVILGCGSSVGSKDDMNSQCEENDYEVHFTEGNHLLAACVGARKAAAAAKAALGLSQSDKMCLSDMVLVIVNKMKALQQVDEECAVVKENSPNPASYSCTLTGNDNWEGTQTTHLWDSATTRRSLGASRREAFGQEEEEKKSAFSDSNVSHSVDESEVMERGRSPSKLASGVRQEAAKFQELLIASQRLLLVLEGTLYAEHKLAAQAAEQHIARSLDKHTGELRKALQRTSKDLSLEGKISAQLLELAAQVSSLQCSKKALEEKIRQSTSNCTALSVNMEEELDRLKQHNETLIGEVNDLRKEKELEGQLARQRAANIGRVLSRIVHQEHLRKWLSLWMGNFISRRMPTTLAARQSENALLLEVARKDGLQDLLLKALTMTLNSLPGKGSWESKQPLTCSVVLAHLQSKDSTSLDQLVRKRLDEAAEWRQSLRALRAHMTEAKAEVILLRELIVNVWGAHFSESLRKLSTCISTVNSSVCDQIRLEEEALRQQLVQAEMLTHNNKELKKSLAKHKKEVLDLQRNISIKDERIIALERENREIQLNCVVSGYDNDGLNIVRKREDLRCSLFTTSGYLHKQEVEQVIVSSASQLAAEAITAITGKDSADSIAEVAELTLELHNRTATALRVMCAVHPEARSEFLHTAEECLRDLHSLQDVRHDILQRLPELLRAPYIE